MRPLLFFRIVCMTGTLLFSTTTILISQKKSEEGFIGKADLYKAKKSALDYLSNNEVIMKFGIIADSIWNFAELGMQEFRSSAILAKTLEKEGFKVEWGVAGMPTCFVGTWGQGEPVIGILGEFDALPMLSQKALTPLKDPIIPGAPGHGCGHNMMGTAGIAAAIAVKKSMELHNIRGTVKFFGSPAEETLISRPYMVRAGVFKGVDAIIDNHASSNFGTNYGVSGTAVMSATFTFTGKTAHAAGAPWSGRSALDAVELMNIATNYLREHIQTSARLFRTRSASGSNNIPPTRSRW